MTSESIFVSYSSKDRPFAMGLTQELQSLGATVWIDQHGIGLGSNWDNSIEDALENAQVLLLIISKTAVASGNVQDEVSIAKEEGMKIVPILIEQCELPMRWKRMQYADYVTDHERAIRRMLEALDIDSSQATRFDKLRDKLTTAVAKAVNIQETEEEKKELETEEKLSDLLISEQEIDRAAAMHKKAIKKNKQLMAFVIAGSIALLLTLQFIIKVPKENLLLTIIGCVLLLALAIIPFLNNNKRSRTLELIDLLKLKRERLTRVINKLTDEDIESFNNEFTNYIAI